MVEFDVGEELSLELVGGGGEEGGGLLSGGELGFVRGVIEELGFRWDGFHYSGAGGVEFAG